MRSAPYKRDISRRESGASRPAPRGVAAATFAGPLAGRVVRGAASAPAQLCATAGLARPCGRRSSGFTLLEVLLAVFVMGCAGVLLSEGLTDALRTINANREDTTLLTLAQAKMAEIAAGVVDVNIENEGTFEEEGYPDYAWQADLYAAETAAPGLWTASVTVRREAEGSAPREVMLHRRLYMPETFVEFLP